MADRTAPNLTPIPACLISWCDANHRTAVRDQRSRIHRRQLATTTGNGKRLNVHLVQTGDVHGIPTEPPHIVMTVVQEDKEVRVEPFPPGVIKLDARRASDLAKMLEAACGPHWLAETLDRGVRMMLDRGGLQ